MSATENTTALIDPADVTADTKSADVFEKGDPCWKCSGTGYVRGFSHVMGGVCFRCGGVGTPLSKRGAAARALYRELIGTPVECIRPGDRLTMEGVPGMIASKRFTVAVIDDDAAEAARTGKAGGVIYRLDREGDVERVEAAAERGATVLPYEPGLDGRPAVTVAEGLTLRGFAKDGTECAVGVSKGTTKVIPLDRAVLTAILKTVAEYQLTLTKAGKPKKRTRWAD